MIELVQRKDIDDKRWNSVIAASKHETIYPYTWYLDASADNWSGLIMNDYECIMPLPFRKKYTVKYIYQPFHNQQLGVYSEKHIDTEIVRIFLAALQSNFMMADYAFNAGNILGEEPGYEVVDRVNYILPIKEEYEELYASFATNTRRNIRKSCQSDLALFDNVSVEDFVALKQDSNPEDKRQFFYNNMKRLLKELLALEKIRIYGVSLKNELCSAAVFAQSKKRMIYLLSASSEVGKEHSAMFHLIDSFIRMHAGQDLLLDFEGSNISSIARFFGGFGAKPEIYQRINYNRLPVVGQRKKKNV